MKTKMKLIAGVLLFSFNVFLIANSYADMGRAWYCCCSESMGSYCEDMSDGDCGDGICPKSWEAQGETFYMSYTST